MAPIIGIIASANWASANASSFDSIATVTGTGSSGTITFSSIPNTYKSLQIRIISRSNRSTAGGWWQVNFNSDTGANYAYHSLRGNGSTVSASDVNTGASYIQFEGLTSAGNTASTFAVAIIDIIDYANTSKNKVLRNLDGFDANGSGLVNLNSGLWLNTSAISSITIKEAFGYNFVSGSTFALYGVK